MNGIPVFSTPNGVGSLIFSEIPYKKMAYIKIQSSLRPQKFLKECKDFCKAVGAEQIFATGHEYLQDYRLHCQIYHFECSKDKIGPASLQLEPVTKKTAKFWSDTYNERMKDVPNSVVITTNQVERMVPYRCCYLVYDGETCVGLGKVSNNRVDAIATCVPGYGVETMRALCSLIEDDTIVLEAALENVRAISLYKKLGFEQKELISKWYCVSKRRLSRKNT